MSPLTQRHNFFRTENKAVCGYKNKKIVVFIVDYSIPNESAKKTYTIFIKSLKKNLHSQL